MALEIARPSKVIEESASAGKTQRKIYKIIIIGDSGVGKTCLAYRFCRGEFIDPDATIGMDFVSRTINLDGDDVTLQLWDTAGQERYGRSAVIKKYYRDAHAAVFVYDVTNPLTLLSLVEWMTLYKQNCNLDIPWILVGNKCDQDVAVPAAMAQTFADNHKMPLIETSALLDSHCSNVDMIFTTLAIKLKARNDLAVPDKNYPERRYSIPGFKTSGQDERPFKLLPIVVKTCSSSCCLFG